MSKVTSKNKKQKKRKSAAKNRINGDSVNPNGIQDTSEMDQQNEANDEPEPDTPVMPTYDVEEEQRDAEKKNNGSHLDGQGSALGKYSVSDNKNGKAPTSGSPLSADSIVDTEATIEYPEQEDLVDSTSPSRGTSVAEQGGSTTTTDATDAPPDETDPRLDALVREKQALRDEVAELRKSIEQMQGKHEEGLGDVKAQLEESRSEKEQAETQYRTLLGRVNTIKSQLGERLKADAVGLIRTIFVALLI